MPKDINGKEIGVGDIIKWQGGERNIYMVLDDKYHLRKSEDKVLVVALYGNSIGTLYETTDAGLVNSEVVARMPDVKKIIDNKEYDF